MLRERIVMLGRRNAHARVAYLFCEFLWRCRAIGLSEDHTLRLPLTQADIADALGLTSVHVNKPALAGFPPRWAHHAGSSSLTLHHGDRLRSLAQLNQNYLHLTGVPAEVERYLERLVRQESGDSRGIAS